MVDGSATSFIGGDFGHCVELVLGWEAGPSNVAGDKGGATVYGIARKFHPSIPWPPSKPEAVQILKHEYWERVRGDELPAPLACVVFDAAVVQGVPWASGALQLLLRVEQDSVIGHETLFAAKRTGEATVRAFTRARRLRFEEIVRQEPLQAQFHEGWIDRADKALCAAARMEGPC